MRPRRRVKGKGLGTFEWVVIDDEAKGWDAMATGSYHAATGMYTSGAVKFEPGRVTAKWLANEVRSGKKELTNFMIGDEDLSSIDLRGMTFINCTFLKSTLDQSLEGTSFIDCSLIRCHLDPLQPTRPYIAGKGMTSLFQTVGFYTQPVSIDVASLAVSVDGELPSRYPTCRSRLTILGRSNANASLTETFSEFSLLGLEKLGSVSGTSEWFDKTSFIEYVFGFSGDTDDRPDIDNAALFTFTMAVEALDAQLQHDIEVGMHSAEYVGAKAPSMFSGVAGTAFELTGFGYEPVGPDFIKPVRIGPIKYSVVTTTSTDKIAYAGTTTSSNSG